MTQNAKETMPGIAERRAIASSARFVFQGIGDKTELALGIVAQLDVRSIAQT
jgi:hypothetical protein